MDNVFKATDADYQQATQRIYRPPQYPSHIVLPLMVAGSDGNQ